MSNFILIGARSKTNSVRTAAFGDIAENDHPNIKYLYAEKATGLGRVVQRVVTSKKLNRFFKMPLRMHWEVNYKDVKPHLSETEDNYIIFVPGEQVFQRTSPSLIRKIRRKHPNCKLVYYFVDGVERSYVINKVSEEYLLDFLRQFDFVCTYSRQDAEKYNFTFIEIPVRHFPVSAESAPAYTLHFAGGDKKRTNLLVNIKKRLDAANISYFYQVVPTYDSDLSRKDIQYSPRKSYEEVADDTQRAGCILEILAVFNTSATLRYKEAVIYNKKLLTNNPEITQLPYYDSRWMRYFETAEDIDLEWLRTVEPVDYGYKGDFSALHFLQTVEKKYLEKHQN